MITTGWDAATYDKVATPQERWGRLVVERMDLTGDELVLDAGCGTGRVTAQLLARLPHGRVIALDQDAGMLDQARKRLAGVSRRIQFVEADLEQPLALAEKVDAVLSTATFHWISDHALLFGNLAQALRPGGLLEAQCGGTGNVDNLRSAVQTAGYQWVPAGTFPTAEETAERLIDAGFVDVNTWLENDEVRFHDPADFDAFLRTVCLRPLLPLLAEAERDVMVDKVMHALDEPVLNYVRLNIHCRLPT